MSSHSKLTESDGIHQPFAWVWADATARGAESVVTDDINKIGYQQDTQVVYLLEDLTPTWTAVAGATAVSTDFTTEDAVTNDRTAALSVGHNSTGAVAAGFGTEIEFQGESDSNEGVKMGAVGFGWKSVAEPFLRPWFQVELYGPGSYTNIPLILTAPDRADNIDALEYRGQNVMEFQGRSAIGYLCGGADSAIISGQDHLISSYSYNSFVAGGRKAVIHARDSVIVGGYANYVGYYGLGAAYSARNAIMGGYVNKIGYYAYNNFIGGGQYNEIVGDASRYTYGATVLGGNGALANFSGQLAMAAGRDTASGQTQSWISPIRASETHDDATWRTLAINGFAYGIPVREDSVLAFTALIVGATSGMAKGFGFRIDGVIENDGGTTALKGTPTVTTLDDSDDTSFNAQAVADDTNDALAVQVQDADGAGDTVRWAGMVTAAEVQYD